MLHITPQEASYNSEEEMHVGLTEEQKLQKQLDARNIKITLAVRGDGTNFPVGCYFARSRSVCMYLYLYNTISK